MFPRLVLSFCLLLALPLGACSKVKLMGREAEPPSLQSLAPRAGEFGGGTLVRIYGGGFQSGMTIQLGSSNCLSVTVISSNEATCLTGPGLVGQADVVATNPDGQSASMSLAFAYTDSVSPVAGRAITSGGGQVMDPSVNYQGSLGTIIRPMIQTGAGMTNISGIQGALH